MNDVVAKLVGVVAEQQEEAVGRVAIAEADRKIRWLKPARDHRQHHHQRHHHHGGVLVWQVAAGDGGGGAWWSDWCWW